MMYFVGTAQEENKNSLKYFLTQLCSSVETEDGPEAAAKLYAADMDSVDREDLVIYVISQRTTCTVRNETVSTVTDIETKDEK